MDITEKFFLQCVKSQLVNSRITHIDKNVNYKKLFSLCMSHGQSVAVYYALKNVNGVDKKFITFITKQAKNRIASQVRREYEKKHLFVLLEENHIKYMEFKGARIKELYLKSELRFFGDNDIYIEGDFEKVKKLLSNDFYFVFNDPHHYVFQNKLSNNIYELHSVLFVGELRKFFINPLNLAKTENGCRYIMSDNELFITCIAHSAYHFAESGGVGVRAIADIAVFLLNGLSLEDKYIENRLKECGLYAFSQKFVQLAKFWFFNGEGNEFTLELSNYILNSKLLSCSEKVSANKLAVMGKGKQHKLKAIINKIFPAFRDMTYTYPVLIKVPVLLPLFYLFRWIKVLFTRPQNIKKITNIKDTSNKEILKAQKLINGLGIKNLI